MRSLSKAARETRDKRKQYVKYQEGAELYSMGVSRFKQMAHECESVIKVGKSAWVDLETFDKYFQLISLAVSTEVPFAKGIVPDHPFMNYCVILIIIEVIITALMWIKWTGRATVLCFSEIMVGIISMFILDAMKPDSIGYCVFITLVYLVGNLVFFTTNSSKYASDEKPVPAGCRNYYIDIDVCLCCLFHTCHSSRTFMAEVH